MIRKIYLEGELGEKYGKVLTLDVNSFQEVFKLLDANFPGFKNDLVKYHENGVGFLLEVGEHGVQNEEEVFFPVAEGDMVITPLPAGAKSGIGKILAAIVIIAATVMITVATGGTGATFASAFMQLGSLGQVAVLTAMSIGMSLAMAGIQQLMAPDPATDSRGPQAYLFNGSEQNIIEGDPVPILYGELRVPGRPISIGVASNANVYYSGINTGGMSTPGDSNYNSGYNSTNDGEVSQEHR